MANDLIEQPKGKAGGISGRVRFDMGSKKSQYRLAKLGFDPIAELVYKYRKLEKELEYQEGMRSGAIVELTSTGKTRAYRAEIHMSIYDKLTSVAEKLLRYQYGRVPETTMVENKTSAPLVVQLTQQGEQYVINDSGDSDDNGDDDEEF